METRSAERRLATIVCIDVAGYSRLIGTDEEGTVARLRGMRRDVLDPLVRHHQGRVVKGTGDGLLAEFASPVEAVRCAINVQRSVLDREALIPASQRLTLRIGINLGDVLFESDGDLYGDGVNIAARLEALCEPGGLCISRSVRDQIRDKLHLVFEDRGEQTVKNIARPVRVFALLPDALDSAPSGSVLQASRRVVAPRQRPSIAVLPFINISSDPEQEYFADGITEEIIIGLSKNPDLTVISRNSTFFYKGRSVRVRELSQQLSVHYVLEGSIRKAGREVRINAQLSEGSTDRNLWSDRYRGSLEDVLAFQDQVVASIVNVLAATDGVIEKTARSVAQAPASNATAYDYYLQGREQFYRPHDEGFVDAEALYQKAIAADPSFARAYSALAWLHFVKFKSVGAASFESILSKAMELALHSAHLDPNDYRSYWVLGCLYMHQKMVTQALAQFERAIRINPNDANLLLFSADALIYAGRVPEALERCRHGIRLNPNCPDWYYWELGAAHFHLGEYGEALNALHRISGPGSHQRLLAAVYAQLGRIEDARTEAAQFMKAMPNFSVATWASTEPYLDLSELERYVDGMRKAGLPE